MNILMLEPVKIMFAREGWQCRLLSVAVWKFDFIDSLTKLRVSSSMGPLSTSALHYLILPLIHIKISFSSFYIYTIKSSRCDCKALSDSSFLSQVRTSLLPTCAFDAPQILPLKKQKKCSRKGRKAGFEYILVLFGITIIPFHTSYTLT
jgi:hypothetical protein